MAATDMGQELWEKQAQARPDKSLNGVFPDAPDAAVAVTEPAKKATKKKA